MKKDPVILKASGRDIADHDWGRLTWVAGARLGNSDEMTLGICEIRPGCSNPQHSHPNCSEVLYVAHGRVSHTASGAQDVILETGDTITIPAGFAHHAQNIGEEDAVLFVAFSSAERESRGE
jgi:quercetin dioxygenase-like cupin family protein